MNGTAFVLEVNYIFSKMLTRFILHRNWDKVGFILSEPSDVMEHTYSRLSLSTIVGLRMPACWVASGLVSRAQLG
ncbi:hypothetical protein NS115_11265 [Paenibacillus jamilae]|uniref:Uncharacterized protein n=1 Tax=Paenibacillus jamilae TaxID=114136 RepID=A0ACC4ZWK5_9BACL|nr:hypothetical protein NS115_11265 [Paenibacillus jamilae]